MKQTMLQIKLGDDPYEAYYLSQGIAVGDYLFISGQTSVDESGKIIGVGDFETQIEQVFKNLDKVLKAGHSELSRVVKVTIFLTDMANFDTVVRYRKKYFSKPYPADTIVEVSSLFHSDVMIEIEAIALKDD